MPKPILAVYLIEYDRYRGSSRYAIVEWLEWITAMAPFDVGLYD